MTLVRRSGVWVLTVGNVVYVGTLRGVLEGVEHGKGMEH